MLMGKEAIYQAIVDTMKQRYNQQVMLLLYKNANKMEDITYAPEYIKMTDTLSGYGYNIKANTNQIILFFGGSNYIAYNYKSDTPTFLKQLP